MSKYQTNLISALTTFDPKMKTYLEVEKRLERKLDILQSGWQFNSIQLALTAARRDTTISNELRKISSQILILRNAGRQQHKAYSGLVSETLKFLEKEPDLADLEMISNKVERLCRMLDAAILSGCTLTLGLSTQLRALLTK